MPDYEVKVIPKFDLNREDSDFIKNKISETASQLGLYRHEDGITYSMQEPYKKYEDIPAGTKFYFKLKKFSRYLLLLEYFSYAEGDINGRIVGNRN